MTREKVAAKSLMQEIIYSDDNWKLLKEKREKSKTIMKALERFNVFIHGSVARGDVNKKSDIDFIIPSLINEFELVEPLDSVGISSFEERKIVQATPLSAIKAVITLKEEISVTFPLIPFYPRENEFYKFGGQIDYNDLCEDKRVPGINKKLIFISPNENGHEETAISKENASIFAKKLYISVDTILERIRVLERRDRIGRTGTFFQRIISPNESFGEILKDMHDKNPASKRRIRRKKV